MEPKAFEEWAIIEIFGHTRLAGLISEARIGEASFLRVDVPASEDGQRQGFTRFYGPAAIYSITIVDEAVARSAAHQLRVRPVTVVYLPQIEAPIYDQRGQEEGYEDEEHGF